MEAETDGKDKRKFDLKSGLDEQQDASGDEEKQNGWNGQTIPYNPDLPVVDAEEYETQFFKFTPQSFTDGLYNGMISYIYEGFQKLDQCLKDEYPDLVTPEQSQKACDLIFPKVTKTLESAFDKLMVYLSTNIFCIPSNVLLPEDEMQKICPASRLDEEALLSEITKLKLDVINAKCRNAKLKQEIQDLGIVQDKWQELIKDMQEAHQQFRSKGITSLRDTMLHLSSIVMRSSESLEKLPKPDRKRLASNLLSLQDEVDEQSNKIKKMSATDVSSVTE